VKAAPKALLIGLLCFARNGSSGEVQKRAQRSTIGVDLKASARRAAAMNAFLTSILVDVLDPIATRAGVGESVTLARRHLIGQIEDSGLVRYHGRPDGPTIGRLGCVISPDADDTALVWRLAPRRPELLRGCLDPGRDPNPTDLGVQMHVLLPLARADPPAARRESPR
jgi:hypothetical protein